MIGAARVVHVTGITAALSASARAAVFAAVEVARVGGALVSLDLNYRSALWSRAEAAQELRELTARADLVFAGGRSLYEAKRGRHAAVHLFPSSIDVDHFAGAREPRPDPEGQAHVPRPRLGWAGVIDERVDLGLLAGVAEARPDWQLVLIGPVADKLDRSQLPQRPNLHWLGLRDYADLPAHMAGWDVGIMPFALNRSTAFISPTKTPEYLAAGLPVVSTPVRDVISPYGDLGLVRIAADVDGWVAAVEAALREGRRTPRTVVDAYLARGSWDTTWAAMGELVDRVAATSGRSRPAARAAVG